MSWRKRSEPTPSVNGYTGSSDRMLRNARCIPTLQHLDQRVLKRQPITTIVDQPADGDGGSRQYSRCWPLR